MFVTSGIRVHIRDWRTPAQVKKGEEVVSAAGEIIAIPVLGGLHHEYRRAA